MILVAGGQLDFNLGALLRRIIQRRVTFRAVLVGPELNPRLTIDLDRDHLVLDGESVRPTACFMRYDVFLGERLRSEAANAAAMNWFAAIKGWELAHDEVRGFNKSSSATESNKLRNLYLARRHGLVVPPSLLSNEFATVRAWRSGPLIVKPAAGGEYTATLDALLAGDGPAGPRCYPRFAQPKLDRPELRVYRIGKTVLGFSLDSPDLDYRTRQKVTLAPARVPPPLARSLVALCDAIGLDFAAADFMCDPETGAFVFLEVNSQPMFAAFDAVCDGRLCDAIIDHLAPKPPPRRPSRSAARRARGARAAIGTRAT
jgi:hypothetical protein